MSRAVSPARLHDLPAVVGLPDIDGGDLRAQPDGRAGASVSLRAAAVPWISPSGRAGRRCRQRPRRPASRSARPWPRARGSVVTGHVDRRDREQVPQRPAGALVLAVAGEPVSEADLVGGFGGGIHFAHREDCLANASCSDNEYKGIACQRGKEVQGRRQPATAQPGAFAGAGGGELGGAGGLVGGVRRESPGVVGGVRIVTSKRGWIGAARHAEPIEQAAVGSAAAQEDVLSGIDDEVTPLKRHGRAAEPRLGLQQGDVLPLPRPG